MTNIDPGNADDVMTRMDELPLAIQCAFCRVGPGIKCVTRVNRNPIGYGSHSIRSSGFWEAYRIGWRRGRILQREIDQREAPS